MCFLNPLLDPNVSPAFYIFEGKNVNLFFCSTQAFKALIMDAFPGSSRLFIQIPACIGVWLSAAEEVSINCKCSTSAVIIEFVRIKSSSAAGTHILKVIAAEGRVLGVVVGPSVQCYTLNKGEICTMVQNIELAFKGHKNHSIHLHFILSAL